MYKQQQRRREVGARSRARVVFVNATVHFPEGSLEFETVLLRDSHDNQSILFLFFLELLLLLLHRRRFFFFYFCCRQHQVSPRNSLLSTHKIASLLGLVQYIYKNGTAKLHFVHTHTHTCAQPTKKSPSTWSSDLTERCNRHLPKHHWARSMRQSWDTCQDAERGDLFSGNCSRRRVT